MGLGFGGEEFTSSVGLEQQPSGSSRNASLNQDIWANLSWVSPLHDEVFAPPPSSPGPFTLCTKWEIEGGIM